VRAGSGPGFAAALAKEAWGAWNHWFSSYSIPGLPWYPSFATFPGPFAPPMPNIPSSIASGVSAAASEMTQGALAAAIKQRAAQWLPGLAGAESFIDTYARWFALAFLNWAALSRWTEVLGQGPVPTFS